MAVQTFSKTENTQLTNNFKISEFHCKGPSCGCTETLHDTSLSAYLQLIRNHFGKPVYITSGYRCSTHQQFLLYDWLQEPVFLRQNRGWLLFSVLCVGYLQGVFLESKNLCIYHIIQRNTALCNKDKSCRYFCRKGYEHKAQGFHTLQTAIFGHIHF